VTVLWAEKHHNRLKIGHLRGNRFVIRIRQVCPDGQNRANQILEYLACRGLPNSYGAQRFGARTTTHLLGRALLHNDLNEFFSVYLGRPQPTDSPEVDKARAFYDLGDLENALRLWPNPNSDEFRALKAVHNGSPGTAYFTLPRELVRLTLAAYQSYLFNLLLQQRLAGYDRLEDGDLAYKHANGACFNVLDAQAEMPRAARLEVSATAPLFGHKVRLAGGAQGERERALLASEGLTLETMRFRGFALEGERRPLRVPLEDASLRQEEQDLVIGFRLPAGAFASVLLREVMKTSECI